MTGEEKGRGQHPRPETEGGPAMLKRFDQFLDELDDRYIFPAVEYGFLFVVCVYQTLGSLPHMAAYL